jgi:fused signal recognition particle receptor
MKFNGSLQLGLVYSVITLCSLNGTYNNANLKCCVYLFRMINHLITTSYLQFHVSCFSTAFHHSRNFFGISSTSRTRSTDLYMVFDFLKKRSEEGFAQVQNIASKTIQGKLGEALSETASYVSLRRKIDSENLRRLTDGLSRSRDRLLSGINGAFENENDDIETRLVKLEEVLLQADLGAVTSGAIVEDLRRYARKEGLAVDDILPVLRARLIEALTPVGGQVGINFAPPGEPTVIFVIGANGMGKTTTIGKIASRLRNEANLTVLLGACDTFRAAAVEQLAEWSVRANVSIERPLPEERGGDPVPVVARSVRRAKEEGFDVCIIDTSGRLSNNFELTQQLQDMKAAIVKELPSGPHETLLVVDGSVGRNAVDQATAW